MASISLPPGAGSITISPRAHKGHAYWRWNRRNNWSLQAWPKGRDPRRLQPITNLQAAVWDIVQHLIKRIAKEEFIIAMDEVKNTAWYTRDCLTAAAYGNWISWPHFGLYPGGPALGPIPKPRARRAERRAAYLRDPPRPNALVKYDEGYLGGFFLLNVELNTPAAPKLLIFDSDPIKIETPAKRLLVKRPHGKRLYFPTTPKEIDPSNITGDKVQYLVPVTEFPPNQKPGWFVVAEHGVAPRTYWSSQRHLNPNDETWVSFEPVAGPFGMIGSGCTGDPAGDTPDSSDFSMVLWADRHDWWRMFAPVKAEDDSGPAGYAIEIGEDNDLASWLWNDPFFGDPRRQLVLPGLSGAHQLDWGLLDNDFPADRGPAALFISCHKSGPGHVSYTLAYVTQDGGNEIITAANDFGDYPFSLRPWRIGASREFTRDFSGCVGDLWLKTGLALDFADPAIREKFIDRRGNLFQPANLATGSAAGLPEPNLYLRGATVDEWLDNRAPGGDPFVTDVGALIECPIFHVEPITA